VKVWGRYLVVSGALLATTLPASTLLARWYGVVVARRFGISMAGTLIAQQALVGVALQRSGRSRELNRIHTLSIVDLLTLSRGASAAVLVGLMSSGVRDRRGGAGWLGWSALLYGAILCDWIDGPIARRFGTSEMGSFFDLESDSWLTLCSAGSTVVWGDLPATVAVPPTLRYLVAFSARRHSQNSDVQVDEPGWARPAGMVQMLLFIAALAPFGGRGTWAVVRQVCPVQTLLQVVGLLVQQRRHR
jgi:phosphatidylglycerophosphate synthase